MYRIPITALVDEIIVSVGKLVGVTLLVYGDAEMY